MNEKKKKSTFNQVTTRSRPFAIDTTVTADTAFDPVEKLRDSLDLDTLSYYN